MKSYATIGQLKSEGRITPMMEQYLEAKETHPDAILFFRLGDFYEMFFEDALLASELLEITLTSRDKSEDPVPMCGVPHHSAAGYIARLVSLGHKVAVCEQVEDPKAAKKLVKRQIVRVVTPGLVDDADLVEARAPRYLMCVALQGEAAGIAYVDVTTGEFRAGLVDRGTGLAEEVGRIAPHELIVSGLDDGEKAKNPPWLSRGARVEAVDALPEGERAEALLAAHFGLGSLDGLELKGLGPGFSAAWGVLLYVKKNLPAALSNITILARHGGREYMFLGEATQQNLELFQSLRGDRKKSNLLSVMDLTRTAMGGRELRRWLLYPLLAPERIEERQEGVAELCARGETRRKVREALREVADIERLSGKLCMGSASPRDLYALARSLALIPTLAGLLSDAAAPILKASGEGLDGVEEAAGRIFSALADSPPAASNEGGIIREGFNPEVDELRAIQKGGRAWIAELQAGERQRTGISTLKIGFNRVFGYFIEVGRSKAEQIPADYERRQTLANSERYVTPALKEMEAKVLGAEERLYGLEMRLFRELAQEVAAYSPRFRITAARVAELDVLAALGELAVSRRYARPRVHSGYGLKIVGGRHPVVEAALSGERFVPNDVEFNEEANRLLVITGPNMSGKSTILRQTAVITLMAQMGSFVPAQSASIGVVDRIFTRVGASDDLAAGRSTFMVEMVETAQILANATAKSLLILDEIGRGTSTFDGLSIAWAVAEHIHGLGCRTLFATHYHELCDLARTLDGVANFNVAVKQWEGRIIFLRRLVEGAVSRSYGIEVARLAGLPSGVLKRAAKVLENLESGELDEAGLPKFAPPTGRKAAALKRQPDLFFGNAENKRLVLLRELAQTNVETTTPLEAMMTLADLGVKARELLKGSEQE